MTELSTETYILYNKTISRVQNDRGRNVLVRNVCERNVLVQKDTWRKTIICIPYDDQICLKSERKAIWRLRNVGKRFIHLFIYLFFKTACLKMYRIVVVFFLHSRDSFSTFDLCLWLPLAYVCCHTITVILFRFVKFFTFITVFTFDGP